MRKEEFVHLCRNWPVQGGYSLAGAVVPLVRTYLFGNHRRKLPVIWLEMNDSGDNNISFLNATSPYVGQVFTYMIDLLYSNPFMAAQGPDALQLLTNAAREYSGKFTLVVEGAVPTKADGLYTVIARTPERPLTAWEILRWLGPLAEYVLAVGTCASFGGPSAARPNLTGSRPIQDVLQRPVIRVSGCPVNSDWFVGTLAHLILYGMPEVDDQGRPTLFYRDTVHRHCQRRSYFGQKVFAEKLGDKECMYSVGCMGPATLADCPYRQWVDHVSWPVKANTPCIGCTNRDFPDGSTPFYQSLAQKRPKEGGRS
ncbi:hydrogenase small subunit [Heliobacillus mobilis]|uniref:Hydrogenase small subunit n=1 Tax=Heliobacterium mobile TaxID=28064 RepID=A0A6I3SKS9_HELMO|nr:hydrogenase small subunit [Heliobacterium mobile]MTV49534.1 hydrogenase small subunit [Heliobacterium mobile]